MSVNREWQVVEFLGEEEVVIAGPSEDLAAMETIADAEMDGGRLVAVQATRNDVTEVAIPAAGDPFTAGLRDWSAETLRQYLDADLTTDQYLYAREGFNA